MKIDKEISHVEIVKTVEELNKRLEDGYILIETIKRRDNDIDGFAEFVHYIIGR